MDGNHELSGDLSGIVKKFADSGVRLQIGKKPQGIGFVRGVRKQPESERTLSEKSTKPKPSNS